MKLRLPSILLSAIVALHFATTTSADVIGAGVFYDVGKITFSSDLNAKKLIEDKDWNDSNYCWAGAACNVIQYWQDYYGNYADEGVDVPNGVNAGYNEPYGTDYLNVYHSVLEHSKRDAKGLSEDLYRWWMQGGTIETTDTSNNRVTVLTSNGDGYFQNIYGTDPDNVYTKHVVKADGEKNALTCFSEYVKDTLNTPGQAMSLTISGTAYHAITCWGYETDNEGNVSALILSDTDDQQFGVFRVEVAVREAYLDFSYYMEGDGIYLAEGEQLTLVTDERHGYYGQDWVWVESATALQIPEGVTAKSTDIKTGVTKGEEILENTQLSSRTEINGAGIRVGDSTKAIVLTGQDDVTLSLNGRETPEGDKSRTTGLTLTNGTMASLDGLSITNYKDGGMQVTGKAYLHEGVMVISDNEKTGDGAGVKTSGYVEIKDCEKVIFSGNYATGNGGAIYNTNPSELPEHDDLSYDVRGEYPSRESTGMLPEAHEQSNYATVSIRGNTSVLFKGNQAKEGMGNDIYNGKGALVNIADNDNVTFVGQDKDSIAVRNEGYLFMVAPKDKSIDFASAALDSTGGSVAIGIDANRTSEDIRGSVKFYENADKSGQCLTLTSTETIPCTVPEHEVFELVTIDKPVPALLENVIVKVDEIVGTSVADSSVTNTTMMATGRLAISCLTLDATDVIASSSTSEYAITLSQVAITLTSDVFNYDTMTFDLVGMFSGNFALNDVTFTLAGEGFENIDLGDITLDMHQAYANTEDVKVYLEKAGGERILANVGNIMLASEPLPEPTTGTLGLLALAGLCGRRRRR